MCIHSRRSIHIRSWDYAAVVSNRTGVFWILFTVLWIAPINGLTLVPGSFALPERTMNLVGKNGLKTLWGTSQSTHAFEKSTRG